MPQKQLSMKRKSYIGLMKGLMYLSAGLTAALVLFLVSYVLIKGIPGITWQLLSTEPSYLSDTISLHHSCHAASRPAPWRWCRHLPDRVCKQQENRRHHRICG